MRITRTCNAILLVLLLLTGARASAQAFGGASLDVQELRHIVPGAGGRAGFPLLFVESRGRYADEVRYHVEHATGVILLTDSEIIFHDNGREDLVLVFPGSCPGVRVRAESRSPTLVHYLIGKEDAWRTDVPTYGRLRYANLWPGIDLVLRGTRGAIKYEFQVAADADPGRIRMRYVGAQLTRNTSGGLEVRDGGGVRRTDPAPVAFQPKDGGDESVRAEFALGAGASDTARFLVGDYDPSRWLVIDPAFLAYSGYLPPAMAPYSIAVDSTGATIVAGIVISPNLRYDACITRIRPDGTGFEFVTYLGSQTGSDIAMGVAVDGSGIYVAGHTDSDETGFPVKVGPDLTFNNPGQPYMDSFVCKLGHDGKSIVYCGYIGGAGNDGVRECAVAVDATGALWIAGQTTSSDFPVVGGPQLAMPGPQPACVTKVAPDGKSIMLSGYLGGSSSHVQYCAGVAVDSNGDAYVVGRTGSDETSFPAKVGPLTKWQGGIDVFVAKIDGRTGAYIYRGYIGGALDDEIWHLAVDGQGAAYVTGQTYSNEFSFPVVNGPLTQATPSYRGDGFVAKVKADGSGFDYSGFLGGAVGRGIAVDGKQRCYLGGNVYGNPAIPVGGALSATPPGPTSVPCGFLVRLSATGKTVEYAGYLGGRSTDDIAALALGPRDTVHITGATASFGTFPLLIGPSFAFNSPGPNLSATFVAKVAEASIVPSGSGQIGTTVAFALLANDDPGLPFVVGTSFGNGPIPLGSRTLGLSVDPLLQGSSSGWWPTIFQGYSGLIGSNGAATASLRIPNQLALIGVRLYTAFLTFEVLHPMGIKSISNVVVSTVR